MKRTNIILLTMLITAPAIAQRWQPKDGNWGLINIDGQVPRYHHCSPYNPCPACRQAQEIALKVKREQEKQQEQDIAELKQLYVMKEALRVLRIAELQEAIQDLKTEKDVLHEEYSKFPESRNGYSSHWMPTPRQMQIQNKWKEIDNKIVKTWEQITALRNELEHPTMPFEILCKLEPKKIFDPLIP